MSSSSGFPPTYQPYQAYPSQDNLQYLQTTAVGRGTQPVAPKLLPYQLQPIQMPPNDSTAYSPTGNTASPPGTPPTPYPERPYYNDEPYRPDSYSTEPPYRESRLDPDTEKAVANFIKKHPGAQDNLEDILNSLGSSKRLEEELRDPNSPINKLRDKFEEHTLLRIIIKPIAWTLVAVKRFGLVPENMKEEVGLLADWLRNKLPKDSDSRENFSGSRSSKYDDDYDSRRDRDKDSYRDHDREYDNRYSDRNNNGYDSRRDRDSDNDSPDPNRRSSFSSSYGPRRLSSRDDERYPPYNNDAYRNPDNAFNKDYPVSGRSDNSLNADDLYWNNIPYEPRPAQDPYLAQRGNDFSDLNTGFDSSGNDRRYPPGDDQNRIRYPASGERDPYEPPYQDRPEPQRDPGDTRIRPRRYPDDGPVDSRYD